MLRALSLANDSLVTIGATPLFEVAVGASEVDGAEGSSVSAGALGK